MLINRNMLHNLVNFIVFVSSMFLLVSCIGGMTPPEARVALDPAGRATDTYKRGPLTVAYSYKSQNDILQISGDIQFNLGVDSLNVRLDFLDQEGKVVKQHLVYSSGYRIRGMEGARRFDTTLKIPDGVTGFAFSSTEKQRTGNK